MTFTPPPWRFENPSEEIILFGEGPAHAILFEPDAPSADRHLVRAALDIYNALWDLVEYEKGGVAPKLEVCIRKAEEAMASARGESCAS